jgi:hypothetical protein
MQQAHGGREGREASSDLPTLVFHAATSLAMLHQLGKSTTNTDVPCCKPRPRPRPLPGVLLRLPIVCADY